MKAKKLWDILAKKLLGSAGRSHSFISLSWQNVLCITFQLRISLLYIDMLYWPIFTALTANTFFWLNCRFFLDSYFVLGFAGFCLVMVFYYWPESTTQRNRDQSDSFYFIFLAGGGGPGRGLFVLLPAVRFSGFCVMTTFYFWQQSTRWKIHSKMIALEKKQLGNSNWLLVQSW